MTVPQPLDKIGDLARRTQACGVLRAAVHRNRPDRLSQRGRGIAGGAGSGAVDGRGGGVPAQPVRHGGDGVGVAGGDGREVPAGPRHAGAHSCGAALRDGVRSSGSAAAGLCARGEGVFRGVPDGKLDHHGEFYDLDFITPQWSAGPIDAPDPKVDIAAVNPWMLRMAGEVADGVHVHPLGEPGYLARHVVPNVVAGAEKSGRSPSDIAVIVPVMTIVGDSDEERHKERELVRASMSFYGSTPNYAFIWDEAGFEGTTARIREKQKAGDFKGMAAQITDEHIATFATESTWDGLADALIEKYGGIATRIVLYNALGDQSASSDMAPSHDA